MYNHILYLVYWVLNTLILLAANSLFPEDIVLGNWSFNQLESAIYAAFWITFFVWAMWDFIMARNVKFKTETGAWSYFLVINILGIWLTARFSHIAGFGIGHFLWAGLIALATNTAQRMAFG